MTEDVENFKPGIYKHYKHSEESPRYYQVIGIARNTETDELHALYVPLYVIPEHRGVRFQVRPLRMFLEDIEWEGQTIKRFTYVGQALH